MKKQITRVVLFLGVLIICSSGNVFAEDCPKTPVPAFINCAEQRLDDLEAQNASQQSVIADLQSRLAAVEVNPVLDLGPYVSLETGTLNDLIGPHIIFTGVNLHLRNGSGSTWGESYVTPNGLGNLIIGYNEVNPYWNIYGRGGSHNVVIGTWHEYSSVGGLVVGYLNRIGGAWASVTGGSQNDAGGYFSSVSGGVANHAEEELSSVSGGWQNSASGYKASVSGGYLNTASGEASTVGGGDSLTAAGTYEYRDADTP
jgi:hypothetical protein